MWGQLIIVLACASEILAEDCVIPSDSQFSRASYRPYHGRTASGKTSYNAGERLHVGTRIRVVCNKDRQGDAVLKVSTHVCSAGHWSPALPVCQEYQRCGAPLKVENAEASERINPYITFPHQTNVHYKCNAGFEKRGTTSFVTCLDGNWTSADIFCVTTTTAKPSTTLTTTTTPITTTTPTATAKSTKTTTPKTTTKPIATTTPKSITTSITTTTPKTATTSTTTTTPTTPTPITTPRPTTTTTAISKTTHRATITTGKEEIKEITTQNDCVIPSGSQFSRTGYRPYHGRAASGKTSFNAGERLPVGTWIRVVCNKDIQGDAVLNVSTHWCSAGNWDPALPVCQEYARCGAPPRVENATASEKITPHITFPDQTVVHYKCNAGFDKRGTTSYAKCVDGEWTSADVICVTTTTATTTTTRTTTTTPITTTTSTTTTTPTTTSTPTINTKPKTTTTPAESTTSTTTTTPPTTTLPTTTTIPITTTSPTTTTTPTTITTPRPITTSTATKPTTHRAMMTSEKIDNKEISTQNNCVIPSGSQFSRASYLPFHGRTASGKTSYIAGERLLVDTWIRVVCNKARQGDAVLNVSNHLCSAENWSPTLPVCQEYARCGAPPRVENAAASERITPSITFPDQTVVHYKCNAGFEKRGTTSFVKCVDGEWTSTDVICFTTTTAPKATAIATTSTLKYCALPTVVDLKDAITQLPVLELVMDGFNVTQACADGRTLMNYCVDGMWLYGFLPCL